MKIKRFNENTSTFEPLKIDDEHVYYEIQVDNSFRKFELALDKIGIKKAFNRYYQFDIIGYFKSTVENNIVLFLNITIINGRLDFNLMRTPSPGYVNKGHIKVEDYELNANKFNV